jgi:hypothetical protein
MIAGQKMKLETEVAVYDPCWLVDEGKKSITVTYVKVVSDGAIPNFATEVVELGTIKRIRTLE